MPDPIIMLPLSMLLAYGFLSGAQAVVVHTDVLTSLVMIRKLSVKKTNHNQVRMHKHNNNNKKEGRRTKMAA